MRCGSAGAGRTVGHVKDHDDTPDRTDSVPTPLTSLDAERRVAQLTGMTPEAAKAFLAFHSGLRTSPRAA